LRVVSEVTREGSSREAVLLDQTDRSGWGDLLIAQLSADLRAEFPGSAGFSLRNLVYMRSFERAWPATGPV